MKRTTLLVLEILACAVAGSAHAQAQTAYGPDNGRWACKAGCGIIVDSPPLELEFLPRAKH